MPNLASWRPPEMALFEGTKGQLNFAQWCRQVAAAASYFMQQPQSSALLYDTDTDRFSICFFGLALAKKRIVMPPNNLGATISQCRCEHQLLLVDDVSNQQLLTSLKPKSDDSLPELSPAVEICFFTSGSSGQPKAIDKQLSQLLKEAEQLQQLWPIAPGTQYIATVSHQHIYGLLFRLLWPLMYKGVCQSQLVEYPETLLTELRANKPCRLISSPAFLQRLEQQDFAAIEDTGVEIDAIFSSGGPLATVTASAVHQGLSVLPLEILGSTETGGIGYRQQHTDACAWQAIPCVNIGLGTDQRLQIRSPYLAEPELWHLCDDRIELITETTFRLLGRADRVVKIEEKRVSLDEMEQLLSSSHLVSTGKMVVLPAKRSIIAAAVELSGAGKKLLNAHGKRAVNAALRELLAQRFDAVTLPRKWRYPEALPYNAQGKLTQAALTELFTDEIKS